MTALEVVVQLEPSLPGAKVNAELYPTSINSKIAGRYTLEYFSSPAARLAAQVLSLVFLVRLSLGFLVGSLPSARTAAHQVFALFNDLLRTLAQLSRLLIDGI